MRPLQYGYIYKLYTTYARAAADFVNLKIAGKFAGKCIRCTFFALRFRSNAIIISYGYFLLPFWLHLSQNKCLYFPRFMTSKLNSWFQMSITSTLSFHKTCLYKCYHLSEFGNYNKDSGPACGNSEQLANGTMKPSSQIIKQGNAPSLASSSAVYLPFNDKL